MTVPPMAAETENGRLRFFFVEVDAWHEGIGVSLLLGVLIGCLDRGMVAMWSSSIIKGRLKWFACRHVGEMSGRCLSWNRRGFPGRSFEVLEGF